jgi:hypothetical protein
MLINERRDLIDCCKQKNVLIYAPGGGYGHFTRALAISKSLLFANVTLCVSSMPGFISLNNNADIHKIPIAAQNDRSEFRMWFTNELLQCKPDVIIIDTFAGGICGELNEVDMSTNYTVLIGRNLKFDAYWRTAGQLRNRINRIYLIEKVSDHYMDYLKTLCSDISYFSIDDNFDTLEEDPVFVNTINQLSGQKWLLVHSGDQDECEKLYEYGQKIAQIHRINPFIFLCGNFSAYLENAKCVVVKMYPVYQYYALFDRVISGAGFNSVRQARKYARAYNFYPFERRYDDQHARIVSADRIINENRPEVNCECN